MPPYKHDGRPTCLCHDCYLRDRPTTISYREANSKHPDCPDCYLSFNVILGEYVNTYCDIHQEAPLETPIKRRYNQAESGTEYAFTLTMPPDYKPKKPIEEAARLILEHGLTSKPYEKPCKWAFVLEHTEQGTPHVHGMYATPSGRQIEKKYFKRYWDLWDPKVKLGHGHKGGYHQKARSSESYAAYLEKEGVVQKNPPAQIISPA